MKQPVWNTAAGSLGNYPSLTPFEYQLSASPQLPAVLLTYALISGTLPAGLSIDSEGLISGIPDLVTLSTTNTFVVRATDNYGNIRDRTFSLTFSGSAVPSFTTTPGNIAIIIDSTWTSIPIEYSNPVDTNPVTIRRIGGILPPGLEINENGLIRGYAKPPTINVNRPQVVTFVVATSESDSTLTCLSTADFLIGRPIIFGGTLFGTIQENTTYYVKSIIDGTTFTISYSAGGSTVPMEDAVGYMSATLPGITSGQPTNQSYSFALKLESPLGSDTQLYSIEVINQNTPVNQGGLGLPPNTRPPTILNTRPETYNITSNIENYGYYVLPPNSEGETYPPTTPAYIGRFTSDNQFEFKILGYDFDGNRLVYNFSGLPLGLVGDSNTGWITGNPIISDNSISEFSFSVYVNKDIYPDIISDTFIFSFRITNDISGDVIWITPENLGIVFNGMISIKSVEAKSDVPLAYRLSSGELPPNLTLLPNGELSGIVAFQPTAAVENPNGITDFTFSIQAYSAKYPVINSTRTFTLSVYQEFGRPFDTLYCKCTPSISDRNLIASLLDNTSLIPDEYLYRSEDPFFGKADSIIYEHAFGIFANDIDAYVAAISKKNHYWRNITLGEIKTAIARDEYTGEILYEVVYSEVIDNLVNYNKMDQYSNYNQSTMVTSQGESVSKEVYWPRRIPLFLGPWYDSETDIYASYEGKNSPPPTYYTSLTPGFARLLYPNSLENMRQQVIDVLGQDYNYNLLPLWMTSQQRNGSTLGYTPAWVIAYCKPGILVTTDTIDSGSYSIGQMYTIKSIGTTDFTTIGAASNTVGLTFTATNKGSGTGTAYLTTEMTYSDFDNSGLTRANYKSYSEQLQFNIQAGWKNEIGQLQTLNTINFKIDRFTVNKSATYNYDNALSPATWTELPSATPTPDPIDSKDFYVLFPRETILPDETQYKQ